jgi:hypothetical protein
MVEVTETQGKEIVLNMQKLGDMEERKVAAAAQIAEKQLEYFKLRDSEIATTQRGLVQAVTGMSETIAQAYTFQCRIPAQHRMSSATDNAVDMRAMHRVSPPSPPAHPDSVPDAHMSENSDMNCDVDAPCPFDWDVDFNNGINQVSPTPVEDSKGQVNIDADDLA